MKEGQHISRNVGQREANKESKEVDQKTLEWRLSMEEELAKH